jgi:hypothetical protein
MSISPSPPTHNIPQSFDRLTTGPTFSNTAPTENPPMNPRSCARRLLCLVLPWSALHAQGIPKNLPKQDVVQVPAIGEGLCVSNAFQSNMVLQRDKPAAIWGWAKPGDKVTVSFSGKSATATAGADRSWKVTLDALPANSKPEVMTVPAAANRSSSKTSWWGMCGSSAARATWSSRSPR